MDSHPRNRPGWLFFYCPAGNATGKKYVIHFVHKDETDGDIRVTIVGNNQAGFSFAFAKDKETVIDAEFKAADFFAGCLPVFVLGVLERKRPICMLDFVAIKQF